MSLSTTRDNTNLRVDLLSISVTLYLSTFTTPAGHTHLSKMPGIVVPQRRQRDDDDDEESDDGSQNSKRARLTPEDESDEDDVSACPS